MAVLYLSDTGCAVVPNSAVLWLSDNDCFVTVSKFFVALRCYAEPCMLCCAVLCCAVLRLSCTVLPAMLCYAVLTSWQYCHRLAVLSCVVVLLLDGCAFIVWLFYHHVVVLP